MNKRRMLFLGALAVMAALVAFYIEQPAHRFHGQYRAGK
jgi:hypothetical protein